MNVIFIQNKLNLFLLKQASHVVCMTLVADIINYFIFNRNMGRRTATLHLNISKQFYFFFKIRWYYFSIICLLPICLFKIWVCLYLTHSHLISESLGHIFLEELCNQHTQPSIWDPWNWIRLPQQLETQPDNLICNQKWGSNRNQWRADVRMPIHITTLRIANNHWNIHIIYL